MNTPIESLGTTQGPKLVLFTTPVPLENLSSDDRTCPICCEPYVALKPTRRIDDEGEWAIRIDMSAAIHGRTRCCGHVFGRKCVEKYLNYNGPRGHLCPICRQNWWDPEKYHSEDPDDEEVEEIYAMPQVPVQSMNGGSGIYRGSRTHRGSGTHRGSVINRGSGTNRGGIARQRSRRIPRSIEFVQQVLNSFEADSNDSIHATVREVNEKLDDIYLKIGRRR